MYKCIKSFPKFSICVAILLSTTIINVKCSSSESIESPRQDLNPHPWGAMIWSPQNKPLGHRVPWKSMNIYQKYTAIFWFVLFCLENNSYNINMLLIGPMDYQMQTFYVVQCYLMFNTIHLPLIINNLEIWTIVHAKMRNLKMIYCCDP
jgi:hypothetical protein